MSGALPGHEAAQASAGQPPWLALPAGVLLTLPWLTPLAGGPSPSVQPWLLSAACTVLLVLLARSALPPRALGVPLLVLAAWAVLRNGAGLDSLALAGGVLLIALAAGATAARGVLDASTIAQAWVLAGVLSTVIALAQYFGAADLLGPFASPSASAEAYANLRQRNQFASLCAIGVAALLWRPPSGAWGRLDPVAIVVLAAGNAATTSRTGLLQLLVLIGLACLWRGEARPRAVRLAALALAAYIAAALLLPWLQALAGIETSGSLWQRVAEASSCSSRVVLWSNVLQLIAERPWRGWGWGELDYAHYATLYPGARFCDILDNAHNLPLHLAAELGLPAALLALAGVAWASWRAHPWAETSPARRLAWAVLLLIALHSLLEYPLWYGPFQIALGLCLGLLCAPRERPDAAGSRAAGAVALLFGAALAYAAWDYHRVSQIYLVPQQRAGTYRDDTLAHIRRSWLFASQARFAELTITPLSRANAAWSWETAQAVLHYSPEPKVAEKAIESAMLLGREQEALWHLARFRAAFPAEHAEWSRQLRQPQGAR